MNKRSVLLLPLTIAQKRFKRLLASLLELSLNERAGELDLIISIDKSDSDECAKIAMSYNWEFGKKIVIEQKENLGLKNHILKCGDLTKDYRGIIMLEDDLTISPRALNYVYQAEKKYSCDEKIATISLYKHSFNETANLPFYPTTDSYDAYFMQLPSSWGQYWSKEKWNEFRLWLSENKDIESFEKSNLVPPNIIRWL